MWAGASRQLDFIPPYGAGAYGPDPPHPVPLRSIAPMSVTICMVEDISLKQSEIRCKIDAPGVFSF